MQDLFQTDLSWLQVQEEPVIKPVRDCRIAGVRVGGMGLSPEHRARISEVLRGRQLSPEHRARISEGLRASEAVLRANQSLEKRQRSAQKQKGSTIKEETRKKIIENSASATPVMTPNGLFPTLRACAQQIAQDLGIPLVYAERKLWLWRRQYPEHYFTLKA